MKRFDDAYRKLMEMLAGDAYGGSESGEHGGDLTNSDWYAPGDARVPSFIGAKKKKKGSKKKGKKKCKGKSVKDGAFEVEVAPVIQRRTFSEAYEDINDGLDDDAIPDDVSIDFNSADLGKKRSIVREDPDTPRFSPDSVSESEIEDIYGVMMAGKTQRGTVLHKKIHDSFLRDGILKTGDKILDYPSGFGHGSQYWIDAGFETEAHEPFYDSAKKGALRPPEYKELDGSDIPKGKYDVVLNSYCVNVVTGGTRRAVLKSAYGALKSGGFLLVSTMSEANALGTGYAFKISDKEYLKPVGKMGYTYQRGYSKSDLLEFLSELFPASQVLPYTIQGDSSVVSCLVKKS